jgi:DNA-binding NarL/FixJ family response regulator
LQLSEGDVLGVVGLGPSQLFGEVPSPTPEDRVAEEADRDGPDAVKPVDAHIQRDLAPVHGLVQSRQRLGAEERRPEKLVLGRKLEFLARQLQDDAAVHDESGHRAVHANARLPGALGRRDTNGGQVVENGLMGGERALARGRDAYARREWSTAYEALAAADREAPLATDDLELLARSAYLLGRDDDYLSSLERAHHAYLAGGNARGAARCSFWIGHGLMFQGQTGPGVGWFARGTRLLESEPDCVERGYFLIPVLLEQSSRGDFEAAHTTAAEATEIGERFGDRDLVAMGLMEQGHALVRLGRTGDGLRLVDETMVAVSTGELSPIVAGIVYCNTIAFCRDVYEVRRAREWTAALTEWCERQPEMVAHNGLCLVHRAEIMTIGGAWPSALEELHRLDGRFRQGFLNRRALGHAAYREGEVLRLYGKLREAEAAYREAARFGRQPQPGLALVRLAQRKRKPAAASIRRAVGEANLPLKRAALLPAYIEIMLAIGDLEDARAASQELSGIAERQESESLRALAAHAAGAISLAEGDPSAALPVLRSAWRAWQELEAPYEAARARVLVGLACAALGDEDGAAVELDAAREVFGSLGAARDVAHVESLTGRRWAGDHGLTKRELEVLRLVASGKSNREIATGLVISERTVARHVQNIFAKLGVSSRSAASVFAAEHELL